MRLAASPRRRRALAVVTATALLSGGLQLLTGTANAADLVRLSESPAEGGTVAGAAVVSATFNNFLSPLSTISVAGSDGTPVCLGTGPAITAADSVRKTLSCTPFAPLSSDTYTVTLRAQDTQVLPTRVDDSYDFVVDATPAAVTATISPDVVSTPSQEAVRVSGTVDEPATLTVTLDDGVPSTPALTRTLGLRSGAYAADLDVTGLADGTLTATVSAVDRVGNSSQASDTAVKDTDGPGQTSTSPADGSTVQPPTTLDLTFDEALSSTPGGSTVTVTDEFGDATSGTVSVSGSTISFTLGMRLLDGTYTVAARVTDPQGNPGTGGFTFTVDGTAPAAPTLALPAAVANAATATGTGEPGATATVVLSDSAGGAATGTVLIGSDGGYSVSIDVSDLAQGMLTGRATARDAAGNTSPASAPATTERDTVAPAVTVNPVTPDPIGREAARGVDVGGTVSDTATLVLTVTDVDGDTVSATRAGGPGAYVFEDVDVSSLADGTLVFTVTASDPLGNTSSDSESAVLDASPPVVVELAVDPARVNAANASSVDVTGRSEPGSVVTVVISDDEGSPVSATATADLQTGRFAVTFDLGELSDGALTVTAQAVDRAGNAGEVAQASAEKDAAAPARPTLEAPVANAANAASYAVTGGAEAGATVTVTVTDGSATRTVTTLSDGEGRYRAVLDVTTLQDGTLTVVARATDGFGNVGPDVSVQREKDTVAPATAEQVRFVDDPVRGAPAGPATATVTGRLGGPDTPDGLQVLVVFSDGSTTTDAFVAALSSDGTFTVAADLAGLADGPVTARVVVVDRVGNRSGTATAEAVKDTAALAFVGSDPQDGQRVASRSTVSGTFNEALDQTASTVEVRNRLGGVVTGASSFSEDGRTLSFTRSGAPFSGAASPYTARFAVTDRSGETLVRTITFGILEAPSVTLTDPVTSANVDAVVATGRTEAGATVTVTVDDGSGATAPVVVTAVAGSDGSYSSAPFSVRSLADGTLTASARAVASDGATSAAATDTATKDTAAPALTGSVPADGSTVPAADEVRLAFDQVVATATVTVTGPAGPVAGTVMLADGGRTVVFSAAAPLPDGGYLAEVTARDGLGNAGTDSVRFDVDSVAPSVTVAATDVNADQPSTTVTGSTEPGRQVRLTLSSGQRSATATATAGPDGDYTAEVDLSSFGEGTLDVVATVDDEAGNRGSATTTADKDSVAPVVTGLTATDTTAATPTSRISGRSETPTAVMIAATDAAGASVFGAAEVAADGTFTGSLDLSGLVDGAVTITATATDTAGNRGTATTTVTKDATAPVVTATSPSGGSSAPAPGDVRMTYAEVPATATLTLAGPSGTVAGTTSPADGGRTVVLTPATTLAPGTYTATSTARDAAGNSRTTTFTFTVVPASPSDPAPSDPAPSDPAPSDPAPTASASPPSGASPSVSPTPSISPSPSPTARSGSGYVGLPSPVRVLDSRSAVGTSRGVKRGAVVLDLSGRLPAGATAAVLNVTVTNPTANGFVVVYPAGNAKPGTSNVNFLAGQTQANEVVVGLPADRRVVVFVDSASAHVIADLVGSFTRADVANQGRVVTQAPERVLDSRSAVGTSRGVKRGEVVLDLSDRLPVGTTSVALNVTVTGASARGFVVVYPTGTTRPGTSNVNVEQGQTQANEVVTRVGAGGRVSLFVDSASAHVIADLVATVVPRDGSGSQLFTAIAQPQRVLDSRPGSGNVGVSAGRKSGTVVLTLPEGAVPAGATGVVLNVTTTGASRTGFVSVFPTGTANPGTSNVNFRPGANQANEVLTAINGSRQVTLFVGGSGTPLTHLVVDVAGYLLPAS